MARVPNGKRDHKSDARLPHIWREEDLFAGCGSYASPTAPAIPNAFREREARMVFSRLPRWAASTLVAVALAGASACGGASSEVGSATCRGDCDCSGDTCSCEAGGTCTFGPEQPSTGDAGEVAGQDGGTAPGAVAPPDDVTYHCDARNNCDLTCGTGCTATCAGRSVCEGTCTDNCTSRCAGTSDCTLVTGTNSTVTCSGGSACTLTLDTGSVVTCQGNSSCTIRCPKGGCRAECAGSTSCTVECGGTEACHIECNGARSAQCAAGSTCMGACEK